MTLLRECSACNRSHDGPKDRRCTGRSTRIEDMAAVNVDSQDSQLDFPLGQASNASILSEDVSQEVIESTVNQVVNGNVIESRESNKVTDSDALFLNVLNRISDKLSRVEDTMATDRLAVAALASRLDSQDSVLASLSDNRRQRNKSNSSKKPTVTVNKKNDSVSSLFPVNNDVSYAGGATADSDVTVVKQKVPSTSNNLPGLNANRSNTLLSSQGPSTSRQREQHNVLLGDFNNRSSDDRDSNSVQHDK